MGFAPILAPRTTHGIAQLVADLPSALVSFRLFSTIFDLKVIVTFINSEDCLIATWSTWSSLPILSVPSLLRGVVGRTAPFAGGGQSMDQPRASLRPPNRRGIRRGARRPGLGSTSYGTEK